MLLRRPGPCGPMRAGQWQQRPGWRAREIDDGSWCGRSRRKQRWGSLAAVGETCCQFRDRTYPERTGSLRGMQYLATAACSAQGAEPHDTPTSCEPTPHSVKLTGARCRSADHRTTAASVCVAAPMVSRPTGPCAELQQIPQWPEVRRGTASPTRKGRGWSRAARIHPSCW